MLKVSIHNQKDKKLKNKSVVYCPKCQSSQWESSFAVSTFCKSCGEHIAIKDDQSKSPLAYPKFAPKHKQASKSENSQQDKNNKEKQKSTTYTKLIIENKDENKGKNKGEETTIKVKQRELKTNKKSSKSNKPTFKSKSSKIKTKKAICLDCGHDHQVNIKSESSICSRCGSYISFRDYNIKNQANINIRTLGDLIIQKKGALASNSVVCNNLTLHGQMSGSVKCFGDVIFKTTCKFSGELSCKNLLIESKSKIKFFKTVVASGVNNFGEVIGNFIVSGPIVIHDNSSLLGNIKGYSVDIKPKANFRGSISIISGDKD